MPRSPNSTSEPSIPDVQHAPPDGHKEPPAPGIGRRAIRSGGWVIGRRGSELVMAFARIVIIERLLSPDDFGVFGMVVLVLSVAEALAETGFLAALIQTRDRIEGHLDTAWTVQVVRGAILSAVLFLAAPLLAALFSNDTLIPYLRAIALAPVTAGFANIGMVYYRRDLQYRRYVSFSIAGNLANLTVSIAVALATQNAWALIAGLLVGKLFGTVFSYVWHPFRPRFRFRRADAAKLYRFGRWITASNVANLVVSQADSFWIGRLLGATPLGVYQMAHRLSSLPVTEVTGSMFEVAFPSYARIQHDKARLRDAFQEASRLSAMLAIPMCIGILAFAPLIVGVLLGPQWLDAIVPLQLLTLWAFARTLHSPHRGILFSTGHPAMPVTMSIVNAFVLVAFGGLVAREYGINGIAILLGVFGLVALPVDHVAARRFLGLRAREQWAPAFASGWCALIAAILTLLLLRLLPGLSDLVALLGAGALFATLFVASLWTLDRAFRIGFESTVRRILRALRAEPPSSPDAPTIPGA